MYKNEDWLENFAQYCSMSCDVVKHGRNLFLELADKCDKFEINAEKNQL